MNYYQQDNIFYACGTPITVKLDSKGETHAYHSTTNQRLSTSDLKFGRVFGGGKDCDIESTSVTMESGFLYLLSGGSEGGKSGKISISLEGGMIGGYLYGGGIDDAATDISVKVSGGAVKYGLFGAGSSRKFCNVDLDFSNIICTNVNTGSKNPDAEAKGSTRLKMTDGHILVLTFSGGENDAFAEIDGGYIEKQIVKNMTGNLHIDICDSIFVPNGVGGVFPMLPEDGIITKKKGKPREKASPLKGSDEKFFDTTDQKGALTFRFFELRHPDIPYELTPFPVHFVGDCIYITFPDETNMLIDTGLPFSWDEVYIGLSKLGIKTINRFIITHPHSDHMGNAAKIIENFDVRELWIPDINAQPAIEAEKIRLIEYNEIIENAAKSGIKVERVADGDTFSIGETEILIINPVRTEAPAVDMNENSIAMKVTYRQSSALLCGDISDKSEKRLAEKYGDRLKTDLLKVAHHGIVYQSYYKFMDCCKMNFAIVPSIREDGVFLKTTRYALEHVNGFDTSKMYTTGRYGKIKAVLNGEKDFYKIYTQYN